MCFLAPAEANNEAEYGDEMIAEESNKLILTYQQLQAKRYRQRMDLMAISYQENYRRLEVNNKVIASRKQGATNPDESTHEQLIQEGEEIMQAIEFGSVVPERENLPYYIISMKWFTKWQKYTGCLKVVDAIDDDDEDAVLGRGS